VTKEPSKKWLQHL